MSAFFLIICRSLEIKHSFKMWLNDNSCCEIFTNFSKTTAKWEKMRHCFEDSFNMIILNWKVNRKIDSLRTWSSLKAEFLNTKIRIRKLIYFQFQVFYLPFMSLKSTGFKCLVKIIGRNYVFFLSFKLYGFNPSRHLKKICGFL